MSSKFLFDNKLPQRFWDKVFPEPNTGCWLWSAGVDSKGYGQVVLCGKIHLSHRLLYKTLVGDPGKLFCCHKCDQPLCVNPDHLFLGTQKDNMLDMVQKNRHGGKNKTHCPQGHEYTEENTRYSTYKYKVRYCRECKKIKALARYYAKRSN